jgi:hypothetical protein
LGTKIAAEGREAVIVAEFIHMFRSVSFVALVFSLALDISAPVGVAAHVGSDTLVSTESSVASLPTIEGRAISESSVLLIIGFALIGAARATRR